MERISQRLPPCRRNVGVGDDVAILDLKRGMYELAIAISRWKEFIFSVGLSRPFNWGATQQPSTSATCSQTRDSSAPAGLAGAASRLGGRLSEGSVRQDTGGSRSVWRRDRGREHVEDGGTDCSRALLAGPAGADKEQRSEGGRRAATNSVTDRLGFLSPRTSPPRSGGLRP